MSSADMCQCAGCFPARQAADAFAKKMAILEKIREIKKRKESSGDRKND